MRPLGDENDKAFALLNALDADAAEAGDPRLSRRRSRARTAARTARRSSPKGQGVGLDAHAAAMLLDLIGEWARYRERRGRGGADGGDQGDARRDLVRVERPDDERAARAYYRIQGPTLVIEYAPQPQGGDAAEHIHTIYRDPTNDYGRKVARR